MTERKVRILFFVLGLTVGIIIGSAVVRVYSDKVNAETSVSKNYVSRLFSNIVGLVYKPKLTKTDSINKQLIAVPKVLTTQKDTSKNANSSTDNALTTNGIKGDSIIETAKPEKGEENTVVITDKLIATSRLQVIENSKKDSLQTKLNPQKTQKPASIYAIEFWQSPLNYRGYKTQKNKIVLYGINKEEPLKLIRVNDKLYLKFQNQYSIIENHSEIHSFEKVFDQQIIAQLNGMK